MPKLTPLKQWFCDTCREVIKRPEDGYIIWNYTRPAENTRSLDHSFRIIHQHYVKPCDDERFPASSALTDWLGSNGMIHGFAMIDPGEYHAPTFVGPGVRSLREWTELMRRLHLPYYEEARRYWSRASGEYFGDANELLIYDQDYLRRMIEHFEQS